MLLIISTTTLLIAYALYSFLSEHKNLYWTIPIAFYAILYIIIFSIFLFFAEKIQLFDEAAIEHSVTYSFVKPWGPAVINGFGKIIPLFKDMFTQLESFFTTVSGKLQH